MDKKDFYINHLYLKGRKLKEIKGNLVAIKYKKYSFIGIGIIILILIFGLFWLYSSQKEIIRAQLIIDSGIVQIKHEGTDWIVAENGVLLAQSDAIRTGNNSSASVILFESSIIRLANNTEIMIKELVSLAEETNVKIQQESGRTWNTLLKISGIDTYEVQTPTTIASVRGTSFYVSVLQNGSTNVGVVRGIINVSSLHDNQTVDGIDLEEGFFVIINPDQLQIPLVSIPLVYDDWIEENIQKEEVFIEGVKGDVFERISPYIDELKDRFGITEEELEALIEGYLKGYYDLPSETPDWVRDIIEDN